MRALDADACLQLLTPSSFLKDLASHRITQDKGGARAAQVVRALDTLMRALTELADLGVQGGGRAGEQLHDAAMLQVRRFSICRKCVLNFSSKQCSCD